MPVAPALTCVKVELDDDSTKEQRLQVSSVAMSIANDPIRTDCAAKDPRPPLLRYGLSLLLLPIVLSASSSVLSLPRTPAEYLERMDLDGDGRISLAEYRDYMSRGFRDMDRDGNGILEGDELPVPGARPVHLRDHLEALRRAFERQDRNGDGYLDAAELAAPPR